MLGIDDAERWLMSAPFFRLPSALPTLLLAVLFVLAGPGPNLAATPPTRDEVIAIVNQFIQAWEKGDLNAYMTITDDHFVSSNPGGIYDKKAAVADFKSWTATQKDVKFYTPFYIVEGDWVLAEYQFCSTDRKTGVRKAEGTASIGRVKNGKLLVWKEYYDPGIGDLQANGTIPTIDHEPSFPYPPSAKNRW